MGGGCRGWLSIDHAGLLVTALIGARFLTRRLLVLGLVLGLVVLAWFAGLGLLAVGLAILPARLETLAILVRRNILVTLTAFTLVLIIVARGIVSLAIVSLDVVPLATVTVVAIVPLLTVGLSLLKRLALLCWIGALNHRLIAQTFEVDTTLIARLRFRTVFEFLVVELIVRTAVLLLALLVVGLGRRNDAEIMFRKLKTALGHDDVTGRLRVAAKLQIFVGHRLCSTSDLYVRSIALVDAAKGITATAAAASTTATASAAMTATAAVLVSRSHQSSMSQITDRF